MTVTVDEILKLVTDLKEHNSNRINNPKGYRNNSVWDHLYGKEDAFEEVIEAIEKLKKD